MLADVLQAAGLFDTAYSKEGVPEQISSLGRSQSSRLSRPAAMHAHSRGRSIRGNGETDEETGLLGQSAKHSSLLSFESMDSSCRAAPLMEQAVAFESG